MADPEGQGHEPPLIAQETIRNIPCLSNFIYFQFNSIQYSVYAYI